MARTPSHFSSYAHRVLAGGGELAGDGEHRTHQIGAGGIALAHHRILRPQGVLLRFRLSARVMSDESDDKLGPAMLPQVERSIDGMHTGGHERRRVPDVVQPGSGDDRGPVLRARELRQKPSTPGNALDVLPPKAQRSEELLTQQGGTRRQSLGHVRGHPATLPPRSDSRPPSRTTSGALEHMSERPLTCMYGGAVIVCDPMVRTPSSAWSAPAAEDPTACVPNVPGHAPVIHPSETGTRVYPHPESASWQQGQRRD